MPEIQFTQFLRPHGVPKEAFIDRPQEVYDQAQLILEAGLTLECEVLQTGTVSFTITHHEDGDLAIELIQNGPKVLETVDKLIMEFDLSEVGLRKVQ